jgi:hypothetical protein
LSCDVYKGEIIDRVENVFRINTPPAHSLIVFSLRAASNLPFACKRETPVYITSIR